MQQLMGELPGDRERLATARVLSTLQMRLGGLRLRSAARMSRSAFWASWADALPTIAARLREVANHVVDTLLLSESPAQGYLAELATSA